MLTLLMALLVDEVLGFKCSWQCSFLFWGAESIFALHLVEVFFLLVCVNLLEGLQ